MVPLEEAHKYAITNGVSIVRETSAKDDTGVSAVFESIAKALIKQHKENPAPKKELAR